ncbi:hypothetical protein AB1N83_011541 [Pleurotus pulmonarius]
MSSSVSRRVCGRKDFSYLFLPTTRLVTGPNWHRHPKSEGTRWAEAPSKPEKITVFAKNEDSLRGPGRWKIENGVVVAGNNEETRDWCLCDNIKRSI